MPRIVGEWFLPQRSDNGATCVQTKFTQRSSVRAQ